MLRASADLHHHPMLEMSRSIPSSNLPQQRRVLCGPQRPSVAGTLHFIQEFESSCMQNRWLKIGWPMLAAVSQADITLLLYKTSHMVPVSHGLAFPAAGPALKGFTLCPVGFDLKLGKRPKTGRLGNSVTRRRCSLQGVRFRELWSTAGLYGEPFYEAVQYNGDLFT